MSETATSVAAVGASMVARAERRRGPGMEVNSKAQKQRSGAAIAVRRACEATRPSPGLREWVLDSRSRLFRRGVPVSHQLRLQALQAEDMWCVSRADSAVCS